MANLKNVQVKLALPGHNVKGAPSLTKQITYLVASATSLADAVSQAQAANPTAIAAQPTLPVVLGTNN